ncbi:DNA polymerase III, beta chain, N-terminal [uncultured Caudovirales phage]|uniref:DNA polymerase III, beta chain, N-terminal n=1 Tax=uncultured Caudovirales phage TaxID=2100421 RepID=A0A6J5L0N7_9CAUD|nr:DNA polymerase III, beta chain, N-terminal [uncultured Caudovirales phage]
MIVRVQKQVIFKSLQTVVNTMKKGPVLKTILLSTANNELIIRSANRSNDTKSEISSIGIEVRIPVTVVVEGTCIIQGVRFLDIIKKAPKKDVDILLQCDEMSTRITLYGPNMWSGQYCLPHLE